MTTDMALTTEIRRLIDGYQVSQAIYVAATLGIADILAEGARTSDEVAHITGTHPPTLYRLLRALASVGVLRELDHERFELTPLGECLRSNVPGSIADWAAFIGRPYRWQAWAELLHSVKTGEDAFRHVHGTDVWTYRATHPDESTIFDRAMTALSRRSNTAVLAAYDFGRFQTLTDVGGGNGAFLAAVLTAYPNLRGVLFDQPHVVSGAQAVLEAAGVTKRCRVIGGSFFESLPDGSDAYILHTVIHDWDDDDAIRILTTGQSRKSRSCPGTTCRQRSGSRCSSNQSRSSVGTGGTAAAPAPLWAGLNVGAIWGFWHLSAFL